MFNKTAPVTEPSPVVIERGDPPGDHRIPLSHLELDLPAPAGGWAAYLADRGISITIDDIGRCIGVSQRCPATPHRTPRE
jgi:hypothetical protein